MNAQQSNTGVDIKVVRNFPKQANSYDCGIFAICAALSCLKTVVSDLSKVSQIEGAVFADEGTFICETGGKRADIRLVISTLIANK